MKNISKQQQIILIAVVLAVMITGTITIRYFKNAAKEIPSETVLAQPVKVMQIGADTKQGDYKTEGTVKAATKVDIIAMANGTIKSVNFKVGDKITSGQPLAYLQDETLSANYANSSLNYSNVSQNQANTKALTDEMVRQSDLGVSRASEMVVAAKINVDTANLSLENIKDLQDKNKEDMKNNAIVSIANYSNTINSALDQINTIYGINGYQIDGLVDTLSVKNSQALSIGKTSYQEAKDYYAIYSQKNYTNAQAEIALNDTISALTKAKKANDNVIAVLAASISSSKFSETSLNLQKTAFNQLRATLIGSIAAAQANLQALQNINLANKRELDGLNNALKASQNQLAQAELGLQNAQASLSSSKQSKNQQLLLSKTSIDGARGQLSVLTTQLSDLTIKAPITGEISAKLIELGSEARVGQKIGEIAQINTVKIIVQLAPEDASSIRIGSIAIIEKGLKGVINNIAPTADSLTKKVQIEIIVDNKDKTLKPETLVSVSLPISSDKVSTHEFNVPLQSVTVNQNETYVFVAEKNSAKKELVELLEVDGETAKIRVKLSGKALLIIDGNKLLKDSDSITF